MTSNPKPMTAAEFWEIKHKIDDEVARLGWSVDYCKRYIAYHYGCRSRLVMTDTQLVHLYETLRLVGLNKPTTKRGRKSSPRKQSARLLRKGRR